MYKFSMKAVEDFITEDEKISYFIQLLNGGYSSVMCDNKTIEVFSYEQITGFLRNFFKKVLFTYNKCSKRRIISVYLFSLALVSIDQGLKCTKSSRLIFFGL